MQAFLRERMAAQQITQSRTEAARSDSSAADQRWPCNDQHGKRCHQKTLPTHIYIPCSSPRRCTVSPPLLRTLARRPRILVPPFLLEFLIVEKLQIDMRIYCRSELVKSSIN